MDILTQACLCALPVHLSPDLFRLVFILLVIVIFDVGRALVRTLFHYVLIRSSSSVPSCSLCRF